MAVGAPLCRNQEYLDNAIQYAVKVIKVGTILDSLPRIFRTCLPPTPYPSLFLKLTNT